MPVERIEFRAVDRFGQSQLGTPPRRPKKGFWSTAMRRISAGSVNVPAPASIVSGLAQ